MYNDDHCVFWLVIVLDIEIAFKLVCKKTSRAKNGRKMSLHLYISLKRVVCLLLN